MNPIPVLGSLNIDLVTQMDRFTLPGEILAARSFQQFSGGKGANQAVACGRLGATVSMFGAVGKDVFTPKLLQSLTESNVRTDDLLHSDGSASGMAHIWVNGQGENSIAIVASANARLDRKYLDTVIPKIKAASWLLLQLEIPLNIMAYVMKQLPSDVPKVILDPAPAQPLEQFPTERLWMITPNENELQSLTGFPTITAEEIEKACRVLFEKTRAKAVLCKAGSRGAYLDNGIRFRHFPGYTVPTVDTTAAGDVFNGTLAVAISEGKAIEEAVPIANAAGALCVTRPGAQQFIPWRKDLEIFWKLNSQSERCLEKQRGKKAHMFLYSLMA